jgi:uncharacterized protein (TIGR03067 family)
LLFRGAISNSTSRENLMFRLFALGAAVIILTSGLRLAADDPKPAARDDAAKQELDKLQGGWICVGYERDGEQHVSKQARAEMKNETLLIRGDFVSSSWEIGGKGGGGYGWRIKLHPAAQPKGFDFTWEAGIEENLGKTQLGVYKVQETKLKMCWREIGAKARPNALKTKKGDKLTVRLYEKDNK